VKADAKVLKGQIKTLSKALEALEGLHQSPRMAEAVALLQGERKDLEDQLVELKARVLERREEGGITICKELVSCGKEGCKCQRGEGHGPYWYAYWYEGAKHTSLYIGGVDKFTFHQALAKAKTERARRKQGRPSS